MREMDKLMDHEFPNKESMSNLGKDEVEKLMNDGNFIPSIGWTTQTYSPYSSSKTYTEYTREEDMKFLKIH